MKKLGTTKFYDLWELSELFEVNERTLREYIYKKKLKARKIGCGWYISDEAVKDFFRHHEKKPERTKYDQEIEENFEIKF